MSGFLSVVRTFILRLGTPRGLFGRLEDKGIVATAFVHDIVAKDGRLHGGWVGGIEGRAFDRRESSGCVWSWGRFLKAWYCGDVVACMRRAVRAILIGVWFVIFVAQDEDRRSFMLLFFIIFVFVCHDGDHRGVALRPRRVFIELRPISQRVLRCGRI